MPYDHILIELARHLTAPATAMTRAKQRIGIHERKYMHKVMFPELFCRKKKKKFSLITQQLIRIFVSHHGYKQYRKKSKTILPNANTARLPIFVRMNQTPRTCPDVIPSGPAAAQLPTRQSSNPAPATEYIKKK